MSLILLPYLLPDVRTTPSYERVVYFTKVNNYSNVSILLATFSNVLYLCVGVCMCGCVQMIGLMLT